MTFFFFFFSFTLLSWDRKAGRAQVQGISVPPLFMFPRLLLNKRALCSRAVGGWGYLQAVTRLIRGSEPIGNSRHSKYVWHLRGNRVRCQSHRAACKRGETLKHRCEKHARNFGFLVFTFRVTSMLQIWWRTLQDKCVVTTKATVKALHSHVRVRK